MGIYKSGRPNKYNPNTGEGKKPPSTPGEYRIRNEETNKIEYIGETNDLNRRMNEHKRNGRF